MNETFTTGAQRDQQGDKLRYDLMSPLAAKRIARVFADGAKRYGDRNWEKGMPFTRVLASALRHLHAYRLGDKGEDHLAQLAWNVEALLHYEEAIKGGTLPADLNDLPRYDNLAGYGGFIADSAPQKEDTVYLAGPMRGVADFNFPVFDKTRDCLTEMGWNVISPADMDRADPDDVEDQAKFAARDTKAIIEKCGAIALLPGWERSEGATAEFFLARWLGLKIISIWTDEDGAVEMRISDADERAAAYRILGR